MRLTSLASALAIGLLAIPLTGCDENALEPDSDGAVRPTASILTADAGHVALGREIYFDKSLSRNSNQSCADCHKPAWGFTGPNPAVNDRGSVYAGSFRQRFGDRKPPSSSYATVSPNLYFDAGEGLWIGGNFWDGRATGWKLGNPAADQAVGPFLNPVEQALPDAACVIWKIREGTYADLWRATFPQHDLDSIEFPAKMNQDCRKSSDEAMIELSAADRVVVDEAYGDVGRAVAAFEGSPEVNAFSSKYDAWKMGAAEFTEQEEWGFKLFTGEKALCSACHTLGENGDPDLFTDFSFDNLGVPANPDNPIYQRDPTFVDLGLGAFLQRVLVDRTAFGSFPDAAIVTATDVEENLGKQKVPTLRNVDARPGTQAIKAYMHNGYFKTLEQVVHFYNTRDVKNPCPGPYTADEAMAADCWPAPEVADNVNTDELGDLGLTAEEEAAIVAFMRTLSDR